MKNESFGGFMLLRVCITRCSGKEVQRMGRRVYGAVMAGLASRWPDPQKELLPCSA